MDPITHWVDVDLDPELAKWVLPIFMAGVAYFAFQYWRIKRRRQKSPPDSP